MNIKRSDETPSALPMKVYIDRGRAARLEPAIVVEYADGTKDHCRNLHGDNVEFSMVQSRDLTVKPHIWMEIRSGNLILVGMKEDV